MGNSPTFQVPYAMIFESQLYAALVAQPVERKVANGQAIGRKSCALAKRVDITNGVTGLSQFKSGFGGIEIYLTQTEPYPPHIALYTSCAGTGTGIDIFSQVETGVAHFLYGTVRARTANQQFTVGMK